MQSRGLYLISFLLYNSGTTRWRPQLPAETCRSECEYAVIYSVVLFGESVNEYWLNKYNQMIPPPPPK
jgi:hypothetical protein